VKLRKRKMSSSASPEQTLFRSPITAAYELRHWLLTQDWFTSRLLPALPRSVRWALRKLFFLPFDLVERILGKREDMVPPKSAIFTGAVDDFKSSGQAQFEHMVAFAGLTPASKVLDVGCGFGRLAVPLTAYLSQDGGYHGMDIVPAAINWSRKNISSRYPNFRFVLADIRNKEYNPRGRLNASEYRFPYDDGTFDVVILNSVFTHLLPEETVHYVSEISRVLKTDGRCYASYSLIDAEAEKSMQMGRSFLNFKRHSSSCWTVSVEVPELAVAYDEGYIRQLYDRSGLAKNYTVYYGHWVDRPTRQDVVLDWPQDLIVSTKQ